MVKTYSIPKLRELSYITRKGIYMISITYSSDVDSIEIRHTAHSREGFAKGAIAVAHWLKGQKGVKSMDEFLAYHP